MSVSIMPGWVATVMILLAGEVACQAQSRLLSWKNARELLAPPLSRERVLMGEAQRNTLFIAMRTHPENSTNRVNLAVVYERLGEPVKAMELYKELVEDEVFYQAAISGFIKNMYFSGNMGGTTRFIALAQSRRPLDWQALLIQSEMYISSRKLPQAQQVLERAWVRYQEGAGRRDPIIMQVEKTHLLNNLGYLYQQMGNREGVSEVRRLLAELGE